MLTGRGEPYSGGELCGGGANRKVLPIWRGEPLTRDGSSVLTLLGESAEEALQAADETVELMFGSHRVIAADLSSMELADATDLLEAGGVLDFRTGLLGAGCERASLLAAAKAVLAWHRDQIFCGTCGAGTAASRAGRSRTCGECGREVFPRVDPAVIVLVEDVSREHCLLLRRVGAPSGSLCLVAGFVESGETLETAAAREVAEEAGLRVRTVRYAGSQPWPYPSSLMVGMRAVAESTPPRPDGEEMAEAAWVSRNELRGRHADWLGSKGVSIELRLLREWLAEAP